MPDFGAWPVWANAAVLLASAAVVWVAGSRLAGYVDAISDRTGIGEGFAGLILLGGITSLPEVAVSVTSSMSGEEVLAVNNLLGAVAVQVTILAFADMMIGRDAITSVVTHPVVLLQATLGITMLAFIAMAVTAGDLAVGPVGLWSAFLLTAYLGGVALLAGYEKGPETWKAQEGPLPDGPRDDEDAPERGRSLARLVASTTVAAACIVVAGGALSQSGAAAAAQTGLGSAFFGATLLAVATSLPEISTVFAAVRLRRYEMALGDIFGTNLFNAALIFVIDLLAPGGPVLGRVGAFSAFGALLGLVLTAIFMAGVIERRDRTVLRMGWDSLAALVVYAAGVVVLFTLRGHTGG